MSLDDWQHVNSVAREKGKMHPYVHEHMDAFSQLLSKKMVSSGIYFKYYQILRLSSVVARVWCVTSLKVPARTHTAHIF